MTKKNLLCEIPAVIRLVKTFDMYDEFIQCFESIDESRSEMMLAKFTKSNVKDKFNFLLSYVFLYTKIMPHHEKWSKLFEFLDIYEINSYQKLCEHNKTFDFYLWRQSQL